MRIAYATILLVLTMPLASAANPAKAFWGASLAAFAAGASMDVSSSYGQIERNPILRSPNGTFGARGASIRFGIVGVTALTQWLIVRKHPHAAVPMAGVNFGVGALLGGLAVRNWNVANQAVE